MAQPQRIMIVRHAEKPKVDDQGQNIGVGMDGSHDEESLAVRGWQRAGALSVLFGSPEIAQSRGLSVPRHLYASHPVSANDGRQQKPQSQTDPDSIGAAPGAYDLR